MNSDAARCHHLHRLHAIFPSVTGSYGATPRADPPHQFAIGAVRLRRATSFDELAKPGPRRRILELLGRSLRCVVHRRQGFASAKTYDLAFLWCRPETYRDISSARIPSSGLGAPAPVPAGRHWRKPFAHYLNGSGSRSAAMDREHENFAVRRFGGHSRGAAPLMRGSIESRASPRARCRAMRGDTRRPPMLRTCRAPRAGEASPRR